jgi:8-oxo-dGTP diphosphatase
MSKDRLFRIGVKALIEQDDKILLLEEDTSNHSIPTEPYWDLVGGKIQEGESLDQALSREIKEEIGIEYSGSPAFYSGVISNHELLTETGERVGLALLIFKVELPAGAQIVLSEESLSYEWVTKEVAAERLANKYPKEFTTSL